MLYSQLDNPGSGINSQEYEAALSAFSSMGADDFVVSGAPWLVNELFVPGLLQNAASIAGNGGTVDVAFYQDGGGLPGAVYASLTAQPFSELAGDLTITLSSSVMLNPGTWWLSVVTDIDFAPANTQWFWVSRTVQSGFGAAFQNPGDGFATGCTTWATKTSCLMTNTPDQVFEIRGSIAAVPEPATLALLGLGLAGIGYQRRRRARAI